MNTARTLLAALLLLPAFALAAAVDITRDDLAKAQKAGDDLVIVDVRSAGEFAKGHVPGAINIPHDQVGARAGELAAHKNKGKVVLYCHSGRRAGLAAATLEGQGFTNLEHLVGDMTGWEQAGEPVAK